MLSPSISGTNEEEEDDDEDEDDDDDDDDEVLYCMVGVDKILSDLSLIFCSSSSIRPPSGMNLLLPFLKSSPIFNSSPV